MATSCHRSEEATKMSTVWDASSGGKEGLRRRKATPVAEQRPQEWTSCTCTPWALKSFSSRIDFDYFIAEHRQTKLLEIYFLSKENRCSPIKNVTIHYLKTA